MDYEKLYQEAVERAMRNFSNEVVTGIFHELKNEDERIRKALIKFMERFPYDRLENDSVSVKEAIAWLEKQGEQKPADKVEPKFKVGQTIKKEGFNLGFIIVKIEDGFYYNDMGDHFPFTDQDNWELVEQKPAEWSEEDEIKETIRRSLLSCCKGSLLSYVLPYDVYEKCLSWLKSAR